MKSPSKKLRHVTPENSWILALFLVIVFLMGGGSRADIASLILLRPLACIALLTGLLMATRDQWRDARCPALFLGAMIVLLGIQLIPLPPAVWTALPGRAIAEGSFKALDMAPNWQPISMDPFMGWNALFALIVPAAAMALMVALGRAVSRYVLAVLLIMIGISALWGILQILTNAPMLYFYRVTNDGVAVGLFANRNHQALLLSMGIPMIAAFVSLAQGSKQRLSALGPVAVLAALTLIVLIGVTGSRAGLLSLAIALPAALYIYSQRPLTVDDSGTSSGKRKGVRGLMIGLGLTAAAALMTGITALAGRGLAIDRLLGQDVGQDARFQAMPTLWEMVWAYFPVGTGAGSFVSVFKVHEPRELLKTIYFNHAHNDVLETLIEHGVPGLLLMIMAVGGVAVAAFRIVRSSAVGQMGDESARLFGLLGVSLLVIAGFGSLFDYPLRTPILSCVAAIAALWCCWALRPVEKLD